VTRLQAVGVMLVALGLIYALLYAAWLRKRREHDSAAIAAERSRTTRDHALEAPALKERPAQVIAEGTYISTTVAQNRLERVTVEGLGNRARATLIVSRGDVDELVRIDRQGEATVIITAARLISARRGRGMVGKFVGANRLVVLQWKAENGDIYETGFLPRFKADVERVESALWWHTGETTEATETTAEDATEPRVSEPAHAEPAHAEPAHAEPADAEPADAEPADAEPATTDSAGRPDIEGKTTS
jgi:hypothetical protein